MQVQRKMVPVLGVMLATLFIFQMLYRVVLQQEKQQCWQELSTTAEYISGEIREKVQDEIDSLHLIRQVMLRQEFFQPEQAEQLYVQYFQPTTIFSEILVLYPDGTLYTPGGTSQPELPASFAQLAEAGEHITLRQNCEGDPCVYYVLPVAQQEQTRAVLFGRIRSEDLSEVFQPVIYNGQANICIVDARDGSYVMDSWHETLGNAFEMQDRKKLRGYENVDMVAAMRNQESGTVAIESQTTGKPMYMYYMPTGISSWQLCIFAQEEVLFEDWYMLRRILLWAGITELVMLLLYFWWNISTIMQLEKSNAEIAQQRYQIKMVSYWDMMTSTYNRNKYSEVLNSFRGGRPRQLGVAYVDMNGLKQINDSSSHEEGDRYIRMVAQVLLAVFPYSCYRIGGDEFVIISSGLSREDFYERIHRLENKFADARLNVSMGFLWEEKCQDLDALLKRAEMCMYEQKRRYYQTHDRRRKPEN